MQRFSFGAVSVFMTATMVFSTVATADEPVEKINLEVSPTITYEAATVTPKGSQPISQRGTGASAEVALKYRSVDTGWNGAVSSGAVSAHFGYTPVGANYGARGHAWVIGSNGYGIGAWGSAMNRTALTTTYAELGYGLGGGTPPDSVTGNSGILAFIVGLDLVARKTNADVSRELGDTDDQHWVSPFGVGAMLEARELGGFVDLYGKARLFMSFVDADKAIDGEAGVKVRLGEIRSAGIKEVSLHAAVEYERLISTKQVDPLIIGGNPEYETAGTGSDLRVNAGMTLAF